MTKTYTERPLPDDFSHAFKDADIRGVYPREIDEVVAYRTARAFVAECAPDTVLVARDMRVSSPDLAQAFIAGVRDGGVEVIDIGMVDTPALYYASGVYGAHGVMITASHNPKHYNGMKLVGPGAVPLTNATGLRAIQKRIVENTFSSPRKRGAIKKRSIAAAYSKYVRSVIPLDKKIPLRIAVDVGNGMASYILPIIQTLPIEVEVLFAEPDGTFPNRDSNPTLAKNQTAIRKLLREGGYDFGVSFDGDADRLAFFDEKGRYINSAAVGALLAEHILQQQPQSTFVYTVFTSKMYEETIKRCGGKAVKARVGHAFIKEVMRARDAVFACEHSAHFYFKDNYFADSGILALLYAAAAYQRSKSNGESFSSMMRPYQPYFQTEEILVEVSDKKATLKAVEQWYRSQDPESVTVYDGVTVRYPDYWLVIKQSVTEDALKYVVEARTKAVAKQAQKELQAVLQRHA